MVTFNDTPLISVRRTAWKNALREMEWFLSGSSNIDDLHKNVRSWWKPWADANGDVPNSYSKQFRRAEGCTTTYVDLGDHFGQIVKSIDEVDQIEYAINTLKNDPYSRRNVITTWHAYDMISSAETKIANCHGTSIQCFVDPKDPKVAAARKAKKDNK